MKSFRPFLIGCEFIIHTDHQPLVYLNNMKLIDSRLARTLEDLSDFNYEIRYTPGKENAAADCLSRLYDPTSVHDRATSTQLLGELPVGLYVISEVAGGGDSLLLSLHIISERNLLKREAVSSPIHLRELLVGELQNNSERYSITFDRLKRKKLRLMRFPGQLPSVEVLFAFGHFFGCVVLVHFGGNKPVGYFRTTIDIARDAPRVHLQCLAGVHYNPLSETPHYQSTD